MAASERGEKLLSKTAWFRPADSVAFMPATPGGELASEMRKVLEEEGKRLSMNIRVIEKSGTKLKNELFKPDLRAGEPCGIPNCIMDMVRDEEGGQSGCCHHKAGALYKAVCTLCEKEGTTAEYFGESGSSGYTRGLEHLAAVRNDQPSKSALAKHLREYHPLDLKNTQAFRTKVIATFSGPLERQISEGVKIHNSEADILMNDKEEWMQPPVMRLQATQEPGGGRREGIKSRRRGTQ